MRLPSCVACKLPVLELRGQYTLLDSLLTSGGVPPGDTAGTWHYACLAASEVGPAWGAALIRSYVDVRHYEQLADTAAWTVVRNPRTAETFALAKQGMTLDLGFANAKSRAVAGGATFPATDREYGLEWDAPLVAEIQAGLRKAGGMQVLAIADRLGIRERLSHPEVLEGAAFRHDGELEGEWTKTFVWAPVEYRVFVPDELVAYAR